MLEARLAARAGAIRQLIDYAARTQKELNESAAKVLAQQAQDEAQAQCEALSFRAQQALTTL